LINFAGGGGYGGRGGVGYNGAAGGTYYGSISAPTEYGSGGGRATYRNKPGGTGGGAIRLDVTGELAMNGSITANGTNGTSYNNEAGGGGSGGSIYVTATSISGAGLFAANGGNGGTGYAGGGGGGRIALHYDDMSGFSGTLQSKGGSGRTYGGAGTIYTKASGDPLPDLLMDNANHGGTWTPITEPDEFGAVTITKGAYADMTSLASVTIADFEVSNSGLVNLPLVVGAGALVLDTSGRLTHKAAETVVMTVGSDLIIGAGASITASMDLSVTGNLTVVETAAINANGRGYSSATGTGAGATHINFNDPHGG